MIYASAFYSTALLERLAYTNIRPTRHRFVEINIRTDSYEVLTRGDLPGWDQPNSETARTFGSLWIEECRSAVLIVPSVIAPIDNNVLFNPVHPDANWNVGPELPVKWDDRLF